VAARGRLSSRLNYNGGLVELLVRYLLVSDLHSNLEALETCLDLAHGKYDQGFCLGDLVGYGPDPNAVIEQMKTLAKVIIRGNHDKACAGLDDASEFNPLARWATEWTREALTPEHFQFLRSLPPGPVSVDQFQLVHGSPLDEDDYILGPKQALPVLRAQQTQIIWFGHTHHQGGFMLSASGRLLEIHIPPKERSRVFTLRLEDGARYLINPGSIGQPRDGDWRAAFAIFDSEQRNIEYYRATYDLHKTQEKMRKARLPEPLIRRLEVGH
jgi:predicted phosphodiesterase